MSKFFYRKMSKLCGSLILAGTVMVGSVGVCAGIPAVTVSAEESDFSETAGERDEASTETGEDISEYDYSEYKAGKNVDDVRNESIDEDSYEVIEISCETDLAELARNCETDSWSVDKYVRLTNNISLETYKNISIPTFGGVFDGNGYSISGLSIVKAGSSYALFRYVQMSGRIVNLSVSGSVVTEMSSGQCALIAGTNYGTIIDCAVSGVVNGNTEVGGVVGYNAATGFIIGCASEVYENGVHSVGGIVGRNDGTVSDCLNHGHVNTNSSDVTVNILELSIEDLAVINSTTNVASFTDVGGIAGITSGNLYDCTNTGVVGYEHVGYNVGGIAGRLEQGYVSNCTNSGKVYGRKDVGGIVGQMEPFLQLEYVTDGISMIDSEVETLLNMMNNAADDLDYYGSRTSDILGDMSDALLDANQISEELPDDAGSMSLEEMKDRIEDIQDNLLTISEDMEIISTYSSELSDILRNGNHELTADLRAIINQANRVASLSSSIRSDVLSYEGVHFSDTSSEDVDYEDGEAVMSGNGRLIDCSNYGTVEADTAVGGIVGRIATEYDMNPEDDVSLSGSQTLYVDATAKALVKGCVNYGRVNSKKDYAGGVAGFAKYGALIADSSFSNVVSESGSYIGGIAGESDSLARECYFCGNVAGKSYIGGIAGKGMDISECASYSTLFYTGEKAGAIAGIIDDEGVITGNRFINTGIGGIDGISYHGGAEAVDYADLGNIEGLPKEFYEFNIIYIADGVEVARITTSYGDTVTEDMIPALPEKEGYFGMWPDYDYIGVTGNAVLEAIYVKWTGSVSSSETTVISEVEKPLLLVVGDFLPGAVLELEHSGNEYEYAVTYPAEALLAASMGVTEYTDGVNVRIALDNPKSYHVEVADNGRWSKAETVVMGSYLTFDMSTPGRFRIEKVKDNSKLLIAVCAAAAVIVTIILTMIIGSMKKKRLEKMQNKPVKAVIFDLDGTIIDTEKYYRRVWPQALEHFGYHPTDEQALELRSLGRPFAPKKLAEWFGEDFDYDAVRSYRKELFEKCIEEEGVKLKPGVKELLEVLREKKITIAIATATDVERTKRYLDMVGIADYFDKICSAANVKEGKPSPDVYIEACRQLGMAPQTCLAVEDAPNGIKAAAAAGCRVVFVPDQTQDEPEAEKLIFAKVATADKIIELLN